jgi:hypothetical protein
VFPFEPDGSIMNLSGQRARVTGAVGDAMGPWQPKNSARKRRRRSEGMGFALAQQDVALVGHPGHQRVDHRGDLGPAQRLRPRDEPVAQLHRDGVG